MGVGDDHQSDRPIMSGLEVLWRDPVFHPLRIVLETGTSRVHLGNSVRDVGAGSTVFAPPNTWVSVENIGKDPVSLIAVFSEPGFEDYMRAISVHEGEKNTPLSRTHVLGTQRNIAIHQLGSAGPNRCLKTRPLSLSLLAMARALEVEVFERGGALSPSAGLPRPADEVTPDRPHGQNCKQSRTGSGC